MISKKNYLAIILSVIGIYVLQIASKLFHSFLPVAMSVSSFKLTNYDEMLSYISIALKFVNSCIPVIYLLSGILMNNNFIHKTKAKSWILAVSIPTAILLCSLFLIPLNINEGEQFWMVGFAYFPFLFGQAIITIAGGSLILLMCNNHRMQSVLSWVYSVTMYFLIFVDQNFTNININTVDEYRKIGTILSVIGAAVLIISGLLTQEQTNEDKFITEIIELDKVGIKQFKYIVGNKYWVLLTLVSTLTFISYIITGTSHWRYLSFYVDNKIISSNIGFAENICSIVFVILSVLIIRRFDALKLLITGRISVVIACVLLLFASSQSYIPLIAGLFFKGVSAGLLSVDFAVNARLVDFIEWKHGVRQENLVIAIRLCVLSAIAYILAGSQQIFGQSALSGIIGITDLGGSSYSLHVILPSILSIIVLILTMKIDLSEKKIDEMRLEIST